MNKYQIFLKKKGTENIRAHERKKIQEAQIAKDEFKKQLKKNELLMKVGMGGNSMLMGTEEVQYEHAQ